MPIVSDRKDTKLLKANHNGLPATHGNRTKILS
jgi:hypothetical protein